jgi:hypothetical protein
VWLALVLYPPIAGSGNELARESHLFLIAHKIGEE